LQHPTRGRKIVKEQIKCSCYIKKNQLSNTGKKEFKKHPDIKVEGNIQPTLQPAPYYTNKVAEWNVFVDHVGAQEIFVGNIPITLVALNATSQVQMTMGASSM